MIKCESCGSVMKPLFYAHSLFCPKGCDLVTSKSDDWQRVPGGDYSYRILSPKEPYPSDAVMFGLLGRIEADAKEIAHDLTLHYKYRDHLQQTFFFPITDTERKYRGDQTVGRDQWAMVIMNE